MKITGRVAASSVSAQEVGGDYYDFVELEDERLGLIIADVSGKGTSAAFYMAEMQGIFHAVSRIAPEPSDFLGHANAAIGKSLERNVFVSVIYGLLDARNETFVLARAGHCAPEVRLPLGSLEVDAKGKVQLKLAHPMDFVLGCCQFCLVPG